MLKRFFILFLAATVVFATGCGVETEKDKHQESSQEAEASSQKETKEQDAEETIHGGDSGDSSEIEAADTVLSPDSYFQVKYIDVGQADASLVECDGHYMLIDGGNREDSQRIYTELKNHNIDHLDLLVASHAHEDHVGGLAGALNYASADQIICPVENHDSDVFENFKKYAEKNGPGITVPSVGDTFFLGSAKVEILEMDNEANDTNNTSIILKVTYGDTSFLWTGDAEREAEQLVLERWEDRLKATVLKVGHHGSDTSTTYPFLRAVAPEYAVISVGEGNTYGHPDENTLSRLKDAEVKVYRTDLQGDIVCSSDGTKVEFTVEKNENANTFEKSGAVSDAQEVPGEAIYILNTNTHKFHRMNCSSVNDMKEKNKQEYTGTREKLIADGYEPCKKCNP